ncbi:MAG: ATP-binding protein [Planctomycetota bacterium]
MTPRTRFQIVLTLSAMALALIVAWWLFRQWFVSAPFPLFLVAVIGGVLLVGWWRYRHVAESLTDLVGALRQMTAKKRTQGLLALGGEFGDVSDAFNEMIRQVDGRQQELQESVDRLSTVLASMDEGVIAVDDRQRILFANRAAGKLLDFDENAAVGERMLEVIRNHMLHEAVSEALANRDVSKKKLNRYELNSDATTSNQILSLKTTQLPGDPCPGVVMVLENVTELRRLEHLRQEFVANVSHELKTPLTAIKAYSETLLGGALEDQQNNRKFLTQIETEADRLHDLIIDMLRLAQIESGHEQFEMASVDLAAEMRDCIERHLAPAQRKQVELQIEESLSPMHVRADREGLREIVDNLIDNAIKYTERGGVVTARWTSRADRAVLEVSDTGIGIPQESLGRVFERFYRVDKARSRELGSTGLGLSIVKHMVQTFGGTVSAESEEGLGSTFRVELLRT